MRAPVLNYPADVRKPASGTIEEGMAAMSQKFGNGVL